MLFLNKQERKDKATSTQNHSFCCQPIFSYICCPSSFPTSFSHTGLCLSLYHSPLPRLLLRPLLCRKVLVLQDLGVKCHFFCEVSMKTSTYNIPNCVRNWVTKMWFLQRLLYRDRILILLFLKLRFVITQLLSTSVCSISSRLIACSDIKTP